MQWNNPIWNKYNLNTHIHVCVYYAHVLTNIKIMLLFCSGRVVDIAFAHLDAVTLGMVDETGNLHIYEIQNSPDGKIETSLVLQINRPENTVPTENHRLVYLSISKDCNHVQYFKLQTCLYLLVFYNI